MLFPSLIIILLGANFSVSPTSMFILETVLIVFTVSLHAISGNVDVTTIVFPASVAPEETEGFSNSIFSYNATSAIPILSVCFV